MAGKLPNAPIATDIVVMAALVMIEQLRRGRTLSRARLEKLLDIAAQRPKVAEALKAALVALHDRASRQ